MSTFAEATPVPPHLSEGERIINTFIAPSKTFHDVKRNPSWWVPWLVISVFSLIFMFAVGQKVGFEQIAQTEISRSKRAEQFERLPPEQKARQLQLTVSITKGISYAIPVTSLIAFAITAAILMATFNFGAGAEIPFKTSMAVVIYSWLPYILHSLLGVVSLFAGSDPEGFNIRNPVATNPAYFMDPTQHRFLYGLASSLDVFNLWVIVLMAIGYSAVSKLKRSTAFAVVLGWYLLFKIVGAALG